MWTADKTRIGILPLRDESYKDRGEELYARRCLMASAIKSHDEFGHVDRGDTQADYVNHAFWEGDDGEDGRPMGSWSSGFPTIFKGGVFRPINNKTFEADTRYRGKSLGEDVAIPDGYPEPVEDDIGIIIAGTKEDGEPELLFFAAGGAAKKLIAANRNSPYQSGTDVHDLDSQGRPSEVFKAKLQAAWEVMLPNYAPTTSSSGAGFNGFFGGFQAGIGFPLGQLNLQPGGGGQGETTQVGILPPGQGGGLLFDGQAPGGGNVGVGVNGGLLFDGQPANGGNVGVGVQGQLVFG